MDSSQESNSVSGNQEIVDLGNYYLDLVQCPLDPNHTLRRHRLPYHLFKCKKNFPNKVKCPYGHFYYADEHEMAHHLKICTHKPQVLTEEIHANLLQSKQARNKNIKYNYDIENYKIDEPYWD